MPQKEFDIRLKNKIDTTDNWSTSTLILLDGEVAYEKTADGKLKMKIGNGQDFWEDLPYKDIYNEELTAHIVDMVAHVTADEKAKWNAKADISQIPDMSGYLPTTLTENTTIQLGANVLAIDANDPLGMQKDALTITMGGTQPSSITIGATGMATDDLNWGIPKISSNQSGIISFDGAVLQDLTLKDYYTKTEVDEIISSSGSSGDFVDLTSTQTIGGNKTFTGAMQVNNSINATGNITGSRVYNAVWNDYAEWFEKKNELDIFNPGEICVWTGNGVEKSTSKNDTRVVGVVSDTYGHILGGREFANMEDNHDKFVPIGLRGRVRCKVVGEVNIGDLIVSSDIEGIGMADNTCQMQSVIGKALEPSLSDGIKSVLILI